MNLAAPCECPVCRRALFSLEFGGIEIDRCAECGGTWLDAGELDLIIELAGVEPGGLSRSLETAPALRRVARRCARCARRMEAVEVVAGDERVELDRCPQGHGLWLDRGETRTVVLSSRRGEEGAVARAFEEILREEFASQTEGD